MEFVFTCADISLTFLISEEDDSDEEDLEGERASESEQEGFEVESSDGNSSNVEGDEGLPSVNTPRIDGMCVPRMHACTHAHARTHARTHTMTVTTCHIQYSSHIHILNRLHRPFVSSSSVLCFCPSRWYDLGTTVAMSHVVHSLTKFLNMNVHCSDPRPPAGRPC